MYIFFIKDKNIIMIIAILIIVFILVIVLIIPLKIRILRDEEANDVDLYIIKSLDLKIDLDDLAKTLNSNNESSSPIIDYIKIYKSKNYIKTILHFSKIRKITIILNQKGISEEGKIIFKVLGMTLLMRFRNYIKKNLKVLNNEYYRVSDKTSKKIIHVDTLLEIRLIYFIFSFLINLKDIPKIIKIFKKGSEKNEQPSNN